MLKERRKMNLNRSIKRVASFLRISMDSDARLDRLEILSKTDEDARLNYFRELERRGKLVDYLNELREKRDAKILESFRSLNIKDPEGLFKDLLDPVTYLFVVDGKAFSDIRDYKEDTRYIQFVSLNHTTDNAIELLITDKTKGVDRASPSPDLRFIIPLVPDGSYAIYRKGEIWEGILNDQVYKNEVEIWNRVSLNEMITSIKKLMERK